ncbi:MAG: hypothetical protein WAX77_14865 [Methylococcaceae bacterium]
MNIAEHKLYIASQIENLPEESLIALEKIIAQLQIKQTENKNLWLAIEQWREQARFNQDDQQLNDEIINSWRYFSWNN